MLLSADMLCLVQSFQQKKLQPTKAKDKSSKSRKLLFIKRKKTPSVNCSTEKLQDERFLQPDNCSSNAFFRKDNENCKTTGVSTICKLKYFWRWSKIIHHVKREYQKRINSRQGLKHLSGSAPSVTCAPIPSPSLGIPLTPSTCRSRQKKFLRHFDVDPEEKVIDYFSCALVADILLQGHLYISKNYFAFYSNVFGYVTKLLIPVSRVTTVTKEKTAFILPNAVAVVTTDHDRHVFSSLLSRDTTYRLMVQVWRESPLSLEDDIAHDNTSDVLRCQSVEDQRAPLAETEESICGRSFSSSEPIITTKTFPDDSPITHVKQTALNKEKAVPAGGETSRLPQSTVLLAVSTVLLVLLFTSAAVLTYRLSLLHDRLTSPPSSASHRSLLEVQEYLDVNLQKLHKVRQSLEVLSLLMETGEGHLQRLQHAQGDSFVLQGSSAEEAEHDQQIKDHTS